MAAVTHAVSTPSTSNTTSYLSGSFTPAADDLLVVFVSITASVSATPTLTSSVGGKTFSLKDTALWGTSTHKMFVFVADQLASNVSQTVTFDCSDDSATGCNITVARVSGITKTGLTAILQTAKSENQSGAGSNPATTFSSSALTGNPTITCISSNDNTNMTEPTDWAHLARPGYGTPVNETTSAYRDSGFTGTTITWANTTNGDYAVLAVEIDASADGGGGTVVPIFDNYYRRQRAA
jgi:hypothetical protein